MVFHVIPRRFAFEPTRTKMKYCPKCKKLKENSEFNKHKGRAEGLFYCCRLCQSAYKREYYQNNKEFINKNVKEYSKLNPDKVKKCRKLSRKRRLKRIPNYEKRQYQKHKEQIKLHQKNNRSKITSYERNRRKVDLNYKLTRYLRTRLSVALKGNPKLKTTIKLIGCSIEFLKEHLEKRFKSGMTWDNYGLWHIDHIRPCASFDLSKPCQQHKCFHYTNLQPLWAEENLKKSDKFRMRDDK